MDKYFWRVLMAGTVGGLVAWILGKAAGNVILITKWPWYGSLPAVVFLGSVAAAIGVYLVTASDVTKTRTIVFAMICGISWQPLMSSALQYVQAAQNKSTVGSTDNATAGIKSATEKGTKAEIKNEVTQSQGIAIETLQAASNTDDLDQKKKLIASSKELIQSIVGASAKEPDTSVETLKNISLAANRTGSKEVAAEAITALGKIGSKTESNPSVAAKVDVYLGQIQHDAQSAGHIDTAALAALTQQKR